MVQSGPALESRNRRHGVRLGNWVGAEEAGRLLATPFTGSLRGRRDRAILAVLLGCALRRSELVALRMDDLQEREGRAVFADIVGKGGRVRTVPVPQWVREAILSWTSAASISGGRIFRAIGKSDRVRTEMTGAAVLTIVRRHSLLAGLELAPHDLRRTCARLCRAAGGGLEVRVGAPTGGFDGQVEQRRLTVEMHLVKGLRGVTVAGRAWPTLSGRAALARENGFWWDRERSILYVTASGPTRAPRVIRAEGVALAAAQR